jgi:hypothetical protein
VPNIFEAGQADFAPQLHRLHHSRENVSAIEMLVLP